MTEPDFTIGIEEEYLLVDTQTMALATSSETILTECQAALLDQVSPEFMSCQIEVGTKPCANVSEARDDLRRLRAGVKQVAERHGITPIAASCHPFGDWKAQPNTDKARYNQLRDDLGGVARRQLVSGMHVHVGLGSDSLRADLMGQMSYFLPHMLALSGSSPFWQGEDTGLASYRISVFDNMPRTGLPPQFYDWEEYERSVRILVDLGALEDASKIWWDLRPSASYPTLESRICDVQPRLDDALSLTALNQCLARMLWRLKTANLRWRRYDPFLVQENRWRAQRYGVTEGLIDFGRREIVSIADLTEELIEMLAEDADVLGCTREIERLRQIAAHGTSSDRQRAVADAERDAGADRDAQLRAVVRHLIEEYEADL